ncbi:aldo/keto reductase [Halolamina litorea]|uniref:Aldo/keto reductase n=1 Tax=Halolamina litorea TaxID=1515593 RepID=A0ABD6BUD9_9EURY|nr:aldo/keto reductase [Halolamina litorea]
MQDISRLGFGTYENDDPEQCTESVRTALNVGYEHVDTAQSYGNEAAVGDGIAESDVDGEDVFVATKLSTENLAYDDAVESAHESVERLGVDSIDLLYVHWPINTYDPEGTIEALNDLHADGVVDAVGLSNFRIDQLDAAIERLDPPLAAHQVECHPMLPQEDLRAHAVEHDYALVAYCPIARNQVADVPEIQAVAEKHDASPAQVSLAWLLSKENLVAIPKATGEAHIRDNWGARDLELDAEDIETIDGIDEHHRIVDFEAAPWNQ